MSNEAVLEVDELYVDREGQPVLRGVSLSARPGEITALLGANGAGKTSTVLAVGGLIPARSGTVRLGETELVGLPPDRVRRSGMAIVQEGHRILGDLSVADNLRAAALAHGRAAVRNATRDAVALFPELEAQLGRPARRLSGGQQQMVALAQGLIQEPRFLVVDELSLGLAPVIVRRLAAVLEQVAERGTGVLLIEQFTTLALELSSHVYVMQGGSVVLSSPAEELRGREELITAAYLSADPQ